MKTRKGTELTTTEINLIKSLQRVAKKWNESNHRLWLFSASGDLCVMMEHDDETNPSPLMGSNEGVNQDNFITSIDGIRNDGGDW